MNIFQRARCSVTRKPIKSILLFLVVFTISSFLLSGMASRTASVKIQDKTRQAIGAGFMLESNETNRHKRMEEISEKIGDEGTLDGVHNEKMDTIYGEVYGVWTDNSFDTLRESDIEKIAGASGICDYNITTGVTVVNPVNFSRIEDKDVDQSKDFQGVSLIGNRDMQMDTNVLSGNVSIKIGRMINREDTEVCVISEELAEQNNLEIGDTLQFNDYHDRENATVYQAEIIGIYTVQQYMTPAMDGDTFRSENVIFTDLRFPEKAEGSENEPFYEKAYFKVQDTREYDMVKENVRKVDIDWERYDLIDNNGNYDTMSANFNDLESVSEALIWIVTLASFIILFFVFVFWLKNRVQEIGIFLCMGVPKIKIAGQVLAEALMIAIIAVSVSFAAAPSVSKLTANYLVEQQVQQEQEEKKLNEGKVAVSGFNETEQKVTGVSAKVTTQMMLFDGVCILALTSLSVITAGATILRKKPKDILSQMS
ncbi:MAG: ABC transporter permease [Lachnospiraceae bacterium]|nr:ABC transporter permease [Lachnospiraceae bacterium]